MAKDDVCEECGSPIRFAEGVNLGNPEQGYRLLCLRCFNAYVSTKLGLDFEHPDFDPVTLEDCDGESHRFEIRTMLSGNVVTLRAVEPLGNGQIGYEAVVYGDVEDDLMDVFQRLYERLRKELGRKHLVQTHLGTQIGEDGVVRGRILWDEQGGGEIPLLMVDGRPVTWDEFGRMLMTYEGWRFKLEILDRDDDS